MKDTDWTLLLCEISALRLEIRAASLLTLATAATNETSKDDYIERAFQMQGRADAIAKGSGA